MANSIAETRRLIKRIVLSNLGCRYGETMTPMISGQHGIGKSAIIRQCAKEMGGKCLTLEASMLSEGEACGLPIASKNPDGNTQITFAPHPIFAAIKRAEKFVYEKAKKGFLGGTLYLNDKGQTVRKVKTNIDGKEVENEVVIGAHSAFEDALAGYENMFKFGEELDFETKLELIEKKEIELVLIFIDELNRTDNQTMRELMNLILNKEVNGYKLPWWCMVVSAVNPCGQNSAYAVNDLDDAQLDRFIKIPVTAKIDEWVDYALVENMNHDLIQAVSVADGIFMVRGDDTLEDKIVATPSPRSWAMIANFMDTMEEINRTSFFTPEERQMLKADFREIVNCKVGSNAGRTMLSNLENKVNAVKPAEILNGDSSEVDKEVLKKLAMQKSIQRKITADSVIRYLCDEIDRFYEYNKSNDIKIRAKFTNFVKQLNQYVNEMDSPTKFIFLKKSVSNEMKTKNGGVLFAKISKFFSKDCIEFLTRFTNEKNDILNS